MLKILWSESLVYKKWQTWAIIREISWRPVDTVQIWRLLDYPGELTALILRSPAQPAAKTKAYRVVGKLNLQISFFLRASSQLP